MEKQAIFEDGVHEYDYSYNEATREHILYYSQGEQWTDHCKGEIIMQIKDTGNELKILSLEKRNQLNYHEAVCLTILLRIIHRDYKFEIATKEEI